MTKIINFIFSLIFLVIVFNNLDKIMKIANGYFDIMLKMISVILQQTSNM